VTGEETSNTPPVGLACTAAAIAVHRGAPPSVPQPLSSPPAWRDSRALHNRCTRSRGSRTWSVPTVLCACPPQVPVGWRPCGWTSAPLWVREHTPCQVTVRPGNCFFLNALEKEAAVKTGCAPSTRDALPNLVHSRHGACLRRPQAGVGSWGGATSVAPATRVARHSGLDSQDLRCVRPSGVVMCRRGDALPSGAALFSHVLRQKAFKEQWRPGTGYALCQREAMNAIHRASNRQERRGVKTTFLQKPLLPYYTHNRRQAIVRSYLGSAIDLNEYTLREVHCLRPWGNEGDVSSLLHEV
jgi:hypothetical protein